MDEMKPKRKKKKDIEASSDEQVKEILDHISETIETSYVQVFDQDAPKATAKAPKYEDEDTLVSHAKTLLKTKEDNPFLVKKTHKKDVTQVIRVNPDVHTGLSTAQVEERVEAGMVNLTNTGSTKTIKMIVFSNVVTLFNLLNFAIAGWLISVSAFRDIIFMFIVSANIIIGIIQEIRAKKTIDQLSLLSAPSALVIRDTEEIEITVSEVVIDDIFKLSSGKQISADCVIKEGVIEVNESLLTGEADAIVKRPGDTLYSGSFVVSGTCCAQVTAVGKNNYIQTLTSQAKKYKKPKSDLLRSLKFVIRLVGALIIPIGAALFIMQYTTPDNLLTYPLIVKRTAGAVIGMIPSGLFLLTSIALAVGVLRLAQNNTLVQELYCIEMLARVNVLCLDKTGTITDGTMTVRGVVEYPNESGLTVKNAVSAMLNALNDNNLTSHALEEKFGRAKRIRHRQLVAFSSTRKLSAVEFDRYGTFVLGAPEFVLKDNYDVVIRDVEKNAADGYRVLVIAHTMEPIVNNEVNATVSPIALILIEDTIRPDAIETIEYFKTHGVQVKVISGDNPITVSKVSERAGIENATKYISLDGLADKDVIRAAERYTVFGRVSPTQKKLLIQTLKNNGNTVAMTGDGVNDILALKEADCSIAMASGSEAARNVSHLVLLDSNFSSMPKVVNEGRRVINNVQRVATLFLTKTIFSFLLSIQALRSQGVYPITPSQLIMIDMLVIGIPSFFLALEPNSRQVTGKFLMNVLRNALPGALVVLINSMIVFGLANALSMGPSQVSTIIVITATFTCMMVLLKISRPFNVMRRILFITMFTLFILAALFLPQFFEFNPLFGSYYTTDGTFVSALELPQILLLIAIVQVSYPLMEIFSNAYGWLRNQIRYVATKLANM